MKSMKIGDMAFFYHAVTDKEIVGIMQVMGEYYPDHTDRTDKFGMVDVEPIMPTEIPVTLAQVKGEPKLSGLPLVRQARLSVLPVTAQTLARFVQDGKGNALTNEANLCAPPQCASLATHMF